MNQRRLITLSKSIQVGFTPHDVPMSPQVPLEIAVGVVDGWLDSEAGRTSDRFAEVKSWLLAAEDYLASEDAKRDDPLVSDWETRLKEASRILVVKQKSFTKAEFRELANRCRHSGIDSEVWDRILDEVLGDLSRPKPRR